MGRYILSYTKGSQVPADEMERAKGFPGLEVLDETPRMLLVSASAETAEAFGAASPDWSVNPEKIYGIPSPRKTVREG